VIRPIRTASEAWLQRHRDTHARHPEFGTHRHPYLLDTIRALAARVGAEEKPSLLDYGCGKGVLLRAMEASGLFRFVRGYDPAVAAFAARPAQTYDVVLCLDVLDQIEAEFVQAVISDVAQLTAGAAVFDVITVQTPALAHLNPRSAATWQELIGRWMRVETTMLRAASEEELRAGACPERAILIAAPR
jgi:2-polyprenyl-3-methyl-5-hydroxy-6-metoxy-1,4-benzoquinol methylase